MSVRIVLPHGDKNVWIIRLSQGVRPTVHHQAAPQGGFPFGGNCSLRSIRLVFIKLQAWSGMIRLGLCCKFLEEPIRFRTTTVTAICRMPRRDALAKLADLCRHNADALFSALEYCAAHGIGDFRVNSQILPVKSHVEAGYKMSDLPDYDAIVGRFRECGDFAGKHNIRTTFHPDQFILLSSPDPDITRRSVAELKYQAEVAEWVGADVINIHGGGAYGDKGSALARVRRNVGRLPDVVRSRLTFENDERVYSPTDLLTMCRDVEAPLVYDVHHHRCLGDGLSVEQATEAAVSTWNREPVFHVSSPREGWRGRNPAYHHDYINPRDFPRCWLGLDLTVEVEAKAKEKAVIRLRRYLDREG